ncbi:hypothetical protein AB0H71_21645 [Nocardia sp. NPDC050697]|uniref:hypothetical protein n=1 Tax=Nocardia sp. NPDC050697 TaxID=3155158 RepID=UPI0033E1AEBB
MARRQCERGRIAVDADPRALALALVGGGHLLAAGTTPDPDGVRAPADAVLADVVTRRLL